MKSIRLSPKTVKAICGGEFPHPHKYAWHMVKMFRLEGGVFQPYDGWGEIIPLPSIVINTEIGCVLGCNHKWGPTNYAPLPDAHGHGTGCRCGETFRNTRWTRTCIECKQYEVFELNEGAWTHESYTSYEESREAKRA